MVRFPLRAEEPAAEEDEEDEEDASEEEPEDAAEEEEPEEEQPASSENEVARARATHAMLLDFFITYTSQLNLVHSIGPKFYRYSVYKRHVRQGLCSRAVATRIIRFSQTAARSRTFSAARRSFRRQKPGEGRAARPHPARRRYWRRRRRRPERSVPPGAAGRNR